MIKTKALLVITISFFVIYSGCSKSDNLVSIFEKSPDGITFTVEGIQSVYSISDTLKFSLKIINTTGVERVYHFSSSCHLGFRLVKDGVVVKAYPEQCAAVLTSLEVKAGGTKEIKVRSLFKGFNGNTLIPGNYTIEIFLLNNNSPVLRTSLELK